MEQARKTSKKEVGGIMMEEIPCVCELEVCPKLTVHTAFRENTRIVA